MAIAHDERGRIPETPLRLLEEAVEAFKAAGTKAAAARKLRLPVETLKSRLVAARKRGLLPPDLEVRKQSILYRDGQEVGRWDKLGLPGANPDEVVKLPNPGLVTKISTLYDQEGRVSQQWVQEKPSEIAKEAAWKAVADELAKALPRVKPVSKPSRTTEKGLLAVYPVGDHHLGMLAWREETGDSYNLEIGESLLHKATDYLLQATIPCEEALIVFLGDFMHYDSFVAQTPTSGHPLDADSRFPKMVRTAIRCMRYMIEQTLRRHSKVRVIIEIGNHDLSSSIFLMECLANVYENEPRISIDTSPRHYHYYRFGKVLLGSHHGHGTKAENLPLLMATDQPKEWGETEHRYILTGHVHHSSKLAQINKDHVGASVESFRILAPADAWASQKGYRSVSDMKCLIIDSEHGEIARHTVRPEMLK
jgi:hypothetical protein